MFRHYDKNIVKSAGKDFRDGAVDTENVSGIIGLETALTISYRDMESNRKNIQYLTSTCLIVFRLPFLGFHYMETVTISLRAYMLFRMFVYPHQKIMIYSYLTWIFRIRKQPVLGVLA